MRAWNVSAFFPEVRPAHLAQQSCTVDASDMAVAARRGLEFIFEAAAIKGKRISVAKLTIVAASKEKQISQGPGEGRLRVKAQAA
jgi:hypothetical protein